MSAIRKLIAMGIAGFLLLAICEPLPAKAADDQPESKKVDEVFADLAKPGSPGCALAAARDGKLLYAKGYGLANIEENVPITPQTVFDIGSTSKQFAAASILLLEKRGKLSINDDIRKYIPELPDYGKKITILHLLNHTSGLRDYLTLFELAGVNIDNVTTDDDALSLITHQKALNFDPGSEWLYSNTGFFLLSIIVKRVSGKTLREFAAENIFSPLQMTATTYRDDHTQLVPNRALAYDPKGKAAGFSLDVSYFEQTGDGAVHTSVLDLLKWDENFYSAQIGSKELLAELQEPGKLNSGKVLNYAKGLAVGKYRGLQTVSHGGSWGGYRAELLRFAEQHFSVVCLCNLSSARPSSRAVKVAEVYLGSLMAPPTPKANTDDDNEDSSKKKETVSLTAGQLKLFEGDYWSRELQIIYRVSFESGALVLHVRNLPPKQLRAISADEFQLEEGPKLKMMMKEGSVSGFLLDAGRTRGMLFEKR
ncbi:MAG TPA: serine hydrolase domain-containing protein [Candidatus Sulfotelmatobacter sp.]|nr:serine hydrolase domain-containing protein [Candidatus Sulfotelmatobacter sp.]